MKLHSCCLFAVAACFACASTSAQTIYRCGSEYTRIPCTDGKVVDAESRVTAAQRAEARQVVLDEQRLGDRMERERLAREAATRSARPANVGPSLPASTALAPAKKTAKKKKRIALPADDDAVVIAYVPKTKKVSN
jgi:hypothetical protein